MVKGVLLGSRLVYLYKKNGTIQNAFLLLKSLKASGYNKNSVFKRLSETVLIQTVSIYIIVTTGHLYQGNRERKTILGNMEHNKTTHSLF